MINAIDIDTIRQWKKLNNLKNKDAYLLLEAYRRFHSFYQSTDIKTAWVGLGTYSIYNSEYFTPISLGSKKVTNWWLLTKKGCKLVEHLTVILPWKKQFTEDIFNQKMF
jgi:predicted alpha/beta-fold hydrolase